MPLIAAISYEILRVGARFYGVPAVRLALQPGLWLQRLTTREPTEDQLAVAIAALERVLVADGMTPADALKAGTSVAAELLGLRRQVGALQSAVRPAD